MLRHFLSRKCHEINDINGDTALTQIACSAEKLARNHVVLMHVQAAHWS